MTRLIRLACVVLLAGCATTQAAGPRLVTFEAKGFMRNYKMVRDDVIRRTAASVLKCEKVTAESPLIDRQKCERVRATQAEWDHRDEVVLDAILTGAPISSFDWEKAAEAAGRFVGAAL